jgi:hypothetical protein
MVRWRHVSRIGEIRNAYIILFGTFERFGQIVRPRNRWGVSIKVHLRNGLEFVDWLACEVCLGFPLIIPNSLFTIIELFELIFWIKDIF